MKAAILAYLADWHTLKEIIEHVPAGIYTAGTLVGRMLAAGEIERRGKCAGKFEYRRR